MGPGSFALDFQRNVRPGLVRDFDAISVLVAALVKEFLHFAPDRVGIGERMIFHRVRDPAHLNRVV